MAGISRKLETSGSSTEKPLLPPGRPFIASARTLTGTVWSTFGQESSTLVRNKFIVVEKILLAIQNNIVLYSIVLMNYDVI
mgnify:CR=1 FL=1